MRKVTGKDVHDAYNDALWPVDLREDYAKQGVALPLRNWNVVDEPTQKLYCRLAESLNKILAEKVESEKP